MPLREVFEVSAHQHRCLVGLLSCRTRDADHDHGFASDGSGRSGAGSAAGARLNRAESTLLQSHSTGDARAGGAAHQGQVTMRGSEKESQPRLSCHSGTLRVPVSPTLALTRRKLWPA